MLKAQVTHAKNYHNWYWYRIASQITNSALSLYVFNISSFQCLLSVSVAIATYIHRIKSRMQSIMMPLSHIMPTAMCSTLIGLCSKPWKNGLVSLASRGDRKYGVIHAIYDKSESVCFWGSPGQWQQVSTVLLRECSCILIPVSLIFFLIYGCPIDHKSTSVQVMARCLISDKQLSGPKFTKFDRIKAIWCGVTRPQRVHL